MHFCSSARLCRAVFSGFRLRKQHKPFNLHTFRPGTCTALAQSRTSAQIAPTELISSPVVTTATPSPKMAHGATRRLTGADAGVTFSAPYACRSSPARIHPASPAPEQLPSLRLCLFYRPSGFLVLRHCGHTGSTHCSSLRPAYPYSSACSDGTAWHFLPWRSGHPGIPS